MKAPLSICIIVKNNELCLEQCILSFKDYVEHIVIVDTGSTDKTVEIAKKYATIFEIFTECNNERGEIESFALARNKAFELAPTDAVCWVDSDDIIVGAEKFNTILQSALDYQKLNNCNCVTYLFKYEYAYNENNQVILEHYRERLFTNKNYITVVNPVHECIIPKENAKMAFVTSEEIIYKHRRQFYKNNCIEPGRNLRILKKYCEKIGDSDARQLYYLGLEYCNNGFVDESIKCLIKYIDISGWEDEKTCACLKLVDIYQSLQQYDNAIRFAFKAIEIKETWCEGYLALSKIFYLKSTLSNADKYRNLEKCIHFAKEGLKLPPTKTLLFVNPLERECEIYKYLNMAYNMIGNVKEALNSVLEGMKKQPDDPMFLNNKPLYENFLARQQIVENANILSRNKILTQDDVKVIAAIINNQPIKHELDINVQDLKSLPPNISNEQMERLIIMVWKQYMLHDETASAISFLNNIPSSVSNSKILKEALLLTESYLGLINTSTEPAPIQIKIENPLNIIFFAGDGWEIWNPKTVVNTGIGGSELMLLEMAKRLYSLGHKVRVYSGCGMEGAYDGVEYLKTEKFKDLECDVLVVSRYAPMLGDEHNIKSKIKILWVHDVYAIAATNELLLKADKIFALTEWHKQNIINIHNVHPDQVIVTRNGIDLNRFNKSINRNKFKCVNSSSPDRSWPILLEVWPQIREQVPMVELHLYYGFKNWKRAAENNPLHKDLIKSLEDRIKELESLGVKYHDRVNQQTLAEEFLSAGAWIHSTWFEETSCITAMEAQAAGLRIVTSNIAALKETVGSRGVLLDGNWTSEEYKKQFIENVVTALTKEDDSDRLLLQKYAKEHFCLNKLAEDWERMFYKLIEKSKINPLNPYQPTNSYKNG